ncbi:MAG: BrnT family toxin [Acidobacteria bacterium]|nr:BrnT family toxin [Acidobacteriota bacterium]
MDLDWDAANIEHVARHRATPAGVQQVFANEPMIIGAQEHPEEERFLCFGRTNTGRFLTVIYTERQKIRGHSGLASWKQSLGAPHRRVPRIFLHVLTVIYTERQGKIRVVTCYRMTRAQQRMYLTGRW